MRVPPASHSACSLERYVCCACCAGLAATLLIECTTSSTLKLLQCRHRMPGAASPFGCFLRASCTPPCCRDGLSYLRSCIKSPVPTHACSHSHPSMLPRWQHAQKPCKFVAQLITTRGAKSITAKLPVTLLEVSYCSLHPRQYAWSNQCETNALHECRMLSN